MSTRPGTQQDVETQNTDLLPHGGLAPLIEG